jgi:tetraprenyl-beta-curcumene synthase
LESAYFPWIGSLHTLLDSLIDQQEDAITDQHSLTARYASREEATNRLQRLAVQANDQAKALPDGQHHTMILTAMVSFYLASPRADDSRVKFTAEQVLTTLGADALPAMLVLRARHRVSRDSRWSGRQRQSRTTSLD